MSSLKGDEEIICTAVNGSTFYTLISMGEKIERIMMAIPVNSVRNVTVVKNSTYVARGGLMTHVSVIRTCCPKLDAGDLVIFQADSEGL